MIKRKETQSDAPYQDLEGAPTDQVVEEEPGKSGCRFSWLAVLILVCVLGGCGFATYWFFGRSLSSGGCSSFVPKHGRVVKGCGKADQLCLTACNLGFVPVEGKSVSACRGGVWSPALKCVQPDALTFLAVGDWGTDEPNHKSALKNDKKGTEQWNLDFNSQENIGYLMGQWAQEHTPSFVIGHGDNFYYNGIWTNTTVRWNNTFEWMYDHPKLQIPWFNVMGNHDFGGGGKTGGAKELKQMFAAQQTYKSPSNDRWHLDDHYYSEKITHTLSDGSSLSVEVFNIDTNAAPTDGYNEICCQCYGRKNEGNCTDPGCRADRDYKNGCAPQADVDSCRQYLTSIFDDCMAKLESGLNASTADWKLVNSHYGPDLHMSDLQRNRVFKILKAGGVQAFFYGHTHGEGHEWKDGTHYFLNGAGGGIRKYGAYGSLWMETAYAFIGAKVAADSVELSFYGFGDGWGNFSTPKAGQGRVLHCWVIPRNGSLGHACAPP